MGNGLYNGLDNGLHNGLYNGVDNGLHNGLYPSEASDNFKFTDKLVAYYPFNDNANDLKNRNNGTVIGSPSYRSGVTVKAIDLENNSNLNHIDFPSSTDLSFTDNTNDIPFSFSFWINIAAISGTGNWLISKRNATADCEYQIVLVSSVLYVQLTDPTFSNYLSVYITAPSLSTWNHVVITYNANKKSSGILIYLNGVKQVTTSDGLGNYTGMKIGNYIMRIGNTPWAADQARKHRGLIDELAIWKDRVLTPIEIAQLYNSRQGRFLN